MPFKDPKARAAYKKQYLKQYYKDHREERKQYNKDHSEKIKAYKKQYRKDHREEIKVHNKQYNKDHPRDRRAENRQYYKDHREEQLTHTKQYHKDHPEVGLKANRKLLKKLGKSFDLDCDEMMYAINAWSKTVRKRDNNKCTWCNSTKTLVSHHIWHKAFCPESALDVDNGITLCHDCHVEQHRLDKL